MTLEEELTVDESLKRNLDLPKNDQSSSGWRFFVNKYCWRPDWSTYDAKQRTRRLQEKAAAKARRNRKRRKHQLHHSKNNINQTKYSNGKTDSDKQLLANAKKQFAGPPSTIDHPIAGLSIPKFINFRKGETINPYRKTKQISNDDNHEQPAPEIADATTNSASSWSIDPMRPPIVSMTQQSAVGDGRFLKARLRDPKIMYIVRLYLAYLYDKESSFCHEGMTPISIKINLASQGLPTTDEELRKIFFDVHAEYGVSKKAAIDDLESYRRHLSNLRIQHLQHIRDSVNKFHNPNFQK